MPLEEIGVFDDFNVLTDALKGKGALLVCGKDKPNPMTIGWAALGVIWGKPILTVLVRPSRHSFELMNSHGEFSVCVPPPSMSRELAFCGTRSGRDFDKFAECKFTRVAGHKIAVAHIAECRMHYECRVVHKNEVTAPALDPGIISQYYGSGDLHTIYYGEVLGAYRQI